MTGVFNFEGINPDEWLDSIPVFQATTIREMLASGNELDQIATSWLSRGGPENTAPFGANSAPTNYYRSVVSEFAKLVCGDKAYNDIRTDIKKVWNGSKTTIVSLIAISISPHVGIAVAALVPIIGILLSIVTRVGVNAWCNNCNEPDKE